jgi:hypothetical protein
MDNRHHGSERERCQGLGLALGMALCAPLGLVLSIATGVHGLIGVGPAMGVALGLALGEHLYQRRSAGR